MSTKLYDEALRAVVKMYSNMGVSKQTALDNLKELRDEIDVYIDVIKNDIEKEEE